MASVLVMKVKTDVVSCTVIQLHKTMSFQISIAAMIKAVAILTLTIIGKKETLGKWVLEGSQKNSDWQDKVS